MFNPFLPDYSGAQSNIQQAQHFFQPFYQSGVQAQQGSNRADAMLMGHPTGLEDQIMSGYRMSPYAQYQTNMLNRQMGNQAALAGDLGTPDEQLALGQQTQGIVSRDQQQYLQNAMQPYHWGLSGLQQTAGRGMGAAGGMAAQQDMLARLSQQRAEDTSGLWGSLLGAGVDVGTQALMGGL